MPRDIFSEVVCPSVQLGSRSWYTLPLSILVHAALAVVLIVVPMMAADVLPMPSEAMTLFAAPPPPLPPEPVVPAPPRGPQPQRPAAPAVNTTAAPREAPSQIAEESAVPMPHVPYTTNVPDGVSGGGFPGAAPVPGPPPLSAPAPPTEPIKPGGHIKHPVKVHHVPPVYPRIAVESKVEGRVMIEAIIGTDGRVTNARILKSRPLLDQAALDAVRQWRFTPTLLNGVPVPVIISVTVDFKLQ